MNIIDGDILFRSVVPEDYEVLKKLHEEFFPIQYKPSFYVNLVVGIGLYGGKLHTIIAVDRKSNKVVGFLLAQLFDYPQQVEDIDLFANEIPSYICYILTLGTRKEYRRSGLGSKMIELCKQYARAEKQCGGVYLHVIEYNSAAIRFYNQNGFQQLRYLEEFYKIDEKYHGAYLYIYYMNNYQPPIVDRFFLSIKSWSDYCIELVHIMIPSLFSRMTVFPTQDTLNHPPNKVNVEYIGIEEQQRGNDQEYHSHHQEKNSCASSQGMV